MQSSENEMRLLHRAISGAHECQARLSQQSRLLHRLRAYLEQVLFDCRLR